jgi:hypothetical protein
MQHYQTHARGKSRLDIGLIEKFCALADPRTLLVRLRNSPIPSAVMKVLGWVKTAFWAAVALSQQVGRALVSLNAKRGPLYPENRNRTALLPGQHDSRTAPRAVSPPLPLPRQPLFKNRWILLWVLVTGVGGVIASSIYVWGPAVRYRFVNVSIADDASAQDHQLAQSMRQQASTNTFVGLSKYPPVLAFEALAKRGAVKQVSFQWLEPGGWSFSEHDKLAFLDKGDIKASAIIGQVSGLVYRARLPRGILLLVIALGASVIGGIGLARIRRAARA